MKTSTSLVIGLALILPFSAVVALMIASGQGQVQPPPTTEKLHEVFVVPLEVQTQYLQQQLAYGRVESAKVSNLGFEMSGKIDTLSVDEGDTVAAGDVIATLDTLRLDATMLELKAALKRAKADARLALQSQKRVSELVKKKLESSQRLDEVIEAYRASQAQVEEIDAQVNTLQVELDKSILIAPFNGTIVTRPVDQGTVVSAGQPIFLAQQSSGFDARIAMTTQQINEFTLGQVNVLQVGDDTLTGTIKSIATSRALNTRTIDVIFAIEPKANNIVPGDLVAVTYQKSISEKGVWVPKEALSSGIRGLWTLFTVTGEGRQTVTSRSVEVLYAGRTHSYVRGALNDTDWMVIHGAQRLVPGQSVLAKASSVTAKALRNDAINQGVAL